MPSIYSSGSGTSTGGSNIPSLTIGSSTGSTQTNIQAGKIAIGITDPGKTLQQSVGNINAGFIGMGKGLVSIAENIPVIGAIAKPIIGGIGGIVDATIGQGVSALEKIRIGDSNLAQAAVSGLEFVGTPLKWGMDALAAPSQFVEQKVAEARLINTQQHKTDLVTSIFGNAPKSALSMMQKGATLEEAATQLAHSNAGFSENGAANFLYSLVLDPMNIILPGIGKFGSIAKEAAFLNKTGVAGLLEYAQKAQKAGKVEIAAEFTKNAQFLEKWQLAGKIYEATMGAVNPITKRFTSTLAKEAASGFTRVVNVSNVSPFLDQLGALVGKDVIERGLKNYATTFANAIKSAAVKTKAAMYRSTAQDFADNVFGDFIRLSRENKTAAEILATPAANNETIGSLLEKVGFTKSQLDESFAVIQDGIANNVRDDELIRKFADQRDVLTELYSTHTITADQNFIRSTAEYRANANSRFASDDAVRLLRQDKLNRLPAATGRRVVVNGVETIDHSQGIAELAQDISAGWGVAPDIAKQFAESQFKIHGSNPQAMMDILTIARGAAFGQAMRELATVRKLFGGSSILSKLTILSGRSLSTEEAYKIRQEVEKLKGLLADAEKSGDLKGVDAMKRALKNKADELVQSYDEFGVFAGDTYSYKMVFDFLDKAESITVKELDKATKFLIEKNIADPNMAEVSGLMKRLEQYGYRLGIAPEQGVTQRVTTLIADRHGREKLTEMTMPFSDTLDHVAIENLDSGLAGRKLRPGTLDRIWESVSRPYGAEVTKANVIERFVTRMVKNTGISVNQARDIMARINTLASERNLRPQALFMERTEVDKIFREVMGDQYGRLKEANTTPIQEILHAAAGDWSVAGLTSGFTGRIKAIKPEITLLTDIIYPEVKFGKLNPYFNLVLERIETEIQIRVYGIKKEAAKEALGEVRGTAARRGYLANTNVSREINDGVMDKLNSRAARNTAAAVEGAQTFKERVSGAIRRFKEDLKHYSSIDVVKEEKRVSRDIMADRFAVREFIDTLEQAAPGKLNELALHFGVNNAEGVVEALINEWLIQSNPVRFAEHVKELGVGARRLSAESLIANGMNPKDAQDLAAAVVGAYEVALLRGSRLADKAQYFASHRSWLERSLNHPFLAIYPYSYMTQKAIPSLMRIMFTPKVFGQVAPGFWYNNWMKAQEWASHQINTDGGVVKALTQNDALLWLVTTLLPTTPDASGFSMPAWLRRGIIQPGLAGKDITPGAFAPTLTEVGSTLVRSSALGQTRTTLEGIQAASDITNINNNISDVVQNTIPNIQQVVLNELGSQIRQP